MSKTLSVVAKELLEKNKVLKNALAKANTNGQYAVLKPYINGQVAKAVATKHNLGYVKTRDLIWSIINAYNGVDTDIEIEV